MKVLLVYRNPSMGFSIGKVFKPIESELKKYCNVISLELPNRNYSISSLIKNILAVRRFLHNNNFDIIHITGTEYYLIPFIPFKKVIVTVHDLGFFTNHDLSFHTLWKWFLWILPLRFAERVTFISEKSKEEAEKNITFKNTQTRVINNPIGVEYNYYHKFSDYKRPVVLHIGTKPNKNLNNTIIALKDIKCHLRIIGILDSNTIALLYLYKIDYSVASDLTDEAIIKEYQNCDIVNFPSLYEGFGMPIIEGQAIGRLVITSNLSPMKEIAGDGAVLVNPFDPESIRRGYNDGMLNSLRYIKAGLTNVKRFSIEQITTDYFKLYKEIAK